MKNKTLKELSAKTKLALIKQERKRYEDKILKSLIDMSVRKIEQKDGQIY